MTAGGAAGVLTVSKVPPGDATGATNTQQYAFQFGVNANPTYTGVFTAHTQVEAPFAGLTPQGNQSMGFYIGTGDQDNYAKVVLTANGGSPGVQFVEEVDGAPTAAPVVPLALPGPDSVDLYLTVDPTAVDRRGQLPRHDQRERGTVDRAGHARDSSVVVHEPHERAGHRRHRHVRRRADVPRDVVGPRSHVGCAELTRS